MGQRTVRIIAGLAMLLGAPALAAPPTVVPSPGYDARLQESRKTTATTPSQPSMSTTAPVTAPHHPRRTHTHH